MTASKGIGRGVGGGNAANRRKTACLRGHAFTEENTRFVRHGANVKRVCRTCARATVKRHRIRYALAFQAKHGRLPMTKAEWAVRRIA